MPSRILLIIFCLLFQVVSYAQQGTFTGIRKVVIDAGHGGKDPGAVSLNRKHREKDITLSVALRLGKLINEQYPDVKVIYTRSTDVFIPLDKRTEIANKNDADLFISIHINAAKARSASGTETFVMGLDKSSSNLEVSKLENSVVVLEGDDYSSRYEGFDPNVPESYIIFSLLQNSHLEQSLQLAALVQEQLAGGPIKVNRGIKQAGLLVLWRTTMPSILVELGFISNSADLEVLVRDENQQNFAQLIFNAFNQYKSKYESGLGMTSYVTAPSDKKADIKPEVKTEPKSDFKSEPKTDLKSEKRELTSEEIKNNLQPKETISQDGFFSVQLLAVAKILKSGAPDLKGIRDAEYKKVGKFYKYHTGNFSTLQEANDALAAVKKKFPQAFIIRIENGTIVPMNK